MRTIKIYFSPTGNTKKIVDAVALGIAGECIDYDITLPQQRAEFSYLFQPEDIVIVGMPVYAGRIPNLLLPFVKSINVGSSILPKGIRAVPVVTFGGRNYDDALIELADLLDNNGFNIYAAGAFVAEHSFSNKICYSCPNSNSLAFAAKLGAIAADRETVKNNTEYEAFERNEIFIGKRNIKGRAEGERVYYKPKYADGTTINMLKVKPKTNMNCNRCGLCAERCPMGSISAKNPAEITGPCIKCNRCVRECKMEAKYFDDAGYLFHVSDLERRFGG